MHHEIFVGRIEFIFVGTRACVAVLVPKSPETLRRSEYQSVASKIELSPLKQQGLSEILLNQHVIRFSRLFWNLLLNFVWWQSILF